MPAAAITSSQRLLRRSGGGGLDGCPSSGRELPGGPWLCCARLRQGSWTPPLLGFGEARQRDAPGGRGPHHLCPQPQEEAALVEARLAPPRPSCRLPSSWTGLWEMSVQGRGPPVGDDRRPTAAPLDRRSQGSEEKGPRACTSGGPESASAPRDCPRPLSVPLTHGFLPLCVWGGRGEPGTEHGSHAPRPGGLVCAPGIPKHLVQVRGWGRGGREGRQGGSECRGASSPLDPTTLRSLTQEPRSHSEETEAQRVWATSPRSHGKSVAELSVWLVHL